MKKIFLLSIACAFLMPPVSAQNIAINTDASKPDANAILDIKSGNKGLLIPRMSTEARNRIPNTKGLLVYDNTTDNFWYNTGREWRCIPHDDGHGRNGDAWLIKGNNNTTDKVNFLGTTNNVPLNIRVNNLPSGRIDSAAGSTFWGYLAGASVNGGLHNTANGFMTLYSDKTGNDNTALGYQSLSKNTTADGNTAIGYQAMYSTTASGRNTAIGWQSMFANTLGGNNTAQGYQSLGSNTTGSENVAIGVGAMFTNTTGTRNTAVGLGALDDNTIGWYNSATGMFAMLNNSTGSYNVSNGVWALSTNETGTLNTAIGAFADVSNSQLSNATAIGGSAIVDASNKVRIGNASVTVIEGQVPFTIPSDGRYKFNVQEDIKGLDFILQLRPVTYQFDVKRFDAGLHRRDSQPNYDQQTAYDEASRIRRSGFIAQEVEKAARATGYDFSGIIRPKNDQDHYSLSYDAFVVPLVKAVQEQQQQIAELKAEIAELKKLMPAAK